jgi:hypothetical protein
MMIAFTPLGVAQNIANELVPSCGEARIVNRFDVSHRLVFCTGRLRFVLLNPGSPPDRCSRLARRRLRAARYATIQVRRLSTYAKTQLLVSDELAKETRQAWCLARPLE